MSYEDLKESIKTLVNNWGEDGEKVVVTAINERKPMPLSEFLTHCDAMGGNWGGMLLSGIHELFPKTWEAIPDDMGIFAFANICSVLVILGIREENN